MFRSLHTVTTELEELQPSGTALVTDEQIAALREEAQRAGDLATVVDTTVALGISSSLPYHPSDEARAEARARCAAVIAEAASA